MRAAPPSVATAPLRSSAPRQHCLGLRGGIDPSIVTGVVVGFLLSRCLAGLEPQFTPEGDRGALASKARGKRQGAGGGPGGRGWGLDVTWDILLVQIAGSQVREDIYL